jgi:autotransporter strand-loop-strand O-heptosyltransferase
MKTRGIEVYKETTKNKKARVDSTLDFKFSFDYGPKIDCSGNDKSQKAEIKFRERGSENYIYVGETQPGLFTTLFRKWFTPWIIEGWKDSKKIYEVDFEEYLKGKKVCVSIDSGSLGDTLAWVPVIKKFGEKYDLDLYITNFWCNLLVHFFPNTKFSHPGYREQGTSAVFGVGWYDEEDRNYHKRDPRSISLQQVAGDILGVEVNQDIMPDEISAVIRNSERQIDGKYVCIATESTANAKHWHYENGWQNVVDYLNSLGYKVVVIHKQHNTLQNVIDKTGYLDIFNRVIDLYHADFFIGIGSGLSWLAWYLNKPVIMISGFSMPFCEFSNKNYRVINRNVCHGCFNDTAHKFDRGDWNWCPRQKDTPRFFECSYQITPQMVQEKINLIIKEEDF